MSFSSDIKRCLCKTEYECPDCRRAELAGFFRFTGRLDKERVKFSTAIPELAERISEAVKAEAGFEITYKDSHASLLNEQAAALKALLREVQPERLCCKTAFVRGAFLGGGSVSDPQKEYHLEFDTKSAAEADLLIGLLAAFHIKAKKTQRKGKELVYLKESSQLADLLGYMSGGRAGLEILSIQVEKELKSSTQRRVNCDSANLNKLAKASSRQITAIRRIKKARKWSSMPEVLREIGDLRMKYPDVSLEELGRMTKQGIGKSGVNHRLNRIMEFADGIQQKEGSGK